MTHLRLHVSLPFPRLPGAALHRWSLRLRARWLAWRGVNRLRVVSPLPATRLPAATRWQESRRHERGLLELNLMLERARVQPEQQGSPGGVAR